jgi:hypothetical protein
MCNIGDVIKVTLIRPLRNKLAPAYYVVIDIMEKNKDDIWDPGCTLFKLVYSDTTDNWTDIWMVQYNFSNANYPITAGNYIIDKAS